MSALLRSVFIAAVPSFAQVFDVAQQSHGQSLLHFPLRVSGGAPIVKNVTKRQTEVAIEDQLNGYFYSIDVGVGTPKQTVTVNFDTGSPELWINPDCSQAQNPKFCESLGHFNESSTFVGLGTQGTILYGTGFVRFNYSYDYVAVGSARVSQQIFGAAESSFFTDAGIMGASPQLSGWDSDYPLFIDNLVKQGFIKSRAFSLDIRSLESERGSVIYGGIDARKFSGRLEKRPIIPGPDSPDGYTRYWVYLDGLSVVVNGKKTTVLAQPKKQAVVLDSGYTLSTLPGPLVEAIVDAFPTARSIEDSPLYAVDCSTVGMDGSIDFVFGKTTIRVPFADFVYQRESDGACRLGVFQDDDFPVLGDTFLRAAYVVYDWDNRNVFIASNEDCGSKLYEIGSGPNAVPDITGECSLTEPTPGLNVTITTPVATPSATLSSMEHYNTSTALSTHASILATGNSSMITSSGPIVSTVTVSNIYTVTSCPPEVTNCPVGSLTTEILTSYKTDAHRSDYVASAIDCSGESCQSSGRTTNSIGGHNHATAQTTATYTIHATSICISGDDCPYGSSTVVKEVVTITPVVENDRPTPISACSSCRITGSSNYTRSSVTSVSDEHPSATTGAKKYSNGSPEPSTSTLPADGSSTVKTANAALDTPSLGLFIISGFLAAIMHNV